MKLEEFIKETLKQIICGVKKAQDATRLLSKHPQEVHLVNPGDIIYSADSAPKGKYFVGSLGSRINS